MILGMKAINHHLLINQQVRVRLYAYLLKKFYMLLQIGGHSNQLSSLQQCIIVFVKRAHHTLWY